MNAWNVTREGYKFYYEVLKIQVNTSPCIYRQKKEVVGGRQHHMDPYVNKRVFIGRQEFTCEIPRLKITIYFMESKSNFGDLSIAEDASDKP